MRKKIMLEGGPLGGTQDEIPEDARFHSSGFERGTRRRRRYEDTGRDDAAGRRIFAYVPPRPRRKG